VVGNPARPVGWMSHDGERLGDDLVCPRSGRVYEVVDGSLRERTPGPVADGGTRADRTLSDDG
jgi:hypothetical protein